MLIRSVLYYSTMRSCSAAVEGGPEPYSSLPIDLRVVTMSKLPVPLSAAQHHALATSPRADTGNPSNLPSQTPSIATKQPKRPSLPAIGISALQSQLSQPSTSQQRRRSSPTLVPRRLTKNYSHLVQDYKQRVKYARRPDGTYSPTTMCVYCEAEPPRLVFFPCQHRCVCDACLRSNEITSDKLNPNAWTACPVCMVDIHLMLPHTGNEEDQYWNWTAEAKPPLPIFFKDEFKDAGKKLRRLSSSAVQPERRRPDSKPLQRDTRANTASTASQHSVRKLSSVSRRYSTGTPQPAVREKHRPPPRSCSIL